MNKLLFSALFALTSLFFNPTAMAADLEINTPAISALKNSMQARHAQLEPNYANGAIGLTRDGLVAVRDATAVPLAQRQALNALVAAENKDRNALYKEIAVANQNPQWESDIRNTFAQRWVEKAKAGWWYQSASGWQQK